MRRFLLDATIWYSIPALFLAVYVARYPFPVDAVWPHLYLVGLIFGAVVLTRAALCWAIGWPTGVRLASSVVIAASLGMLCVYYGLVIVGLESWGRVISWNLIATYALQAPELADALGMPLPMVLAVLGLTALAAVWVVWVYLGRYDWIPAATHGRSGLLLGLVVGCGFAIVAIQAYRFAAVPWAQRFEPFSLTFFPSLVVQDMQSHGTDAVRAQLLSRIDDEERSKYMPNPNARRRNLVLIVVDALRADHMGVYGYSRDTTPNLARLARAGVVRRADPIYAACGESLCGLVSLASSKFMQHFSGRGFTLQEVLRRHGYRTHMILGGDHKNFYGMADFYGKVDSFYDGSQAHGYYMNDDAHVLDHVAASPAWDGVPVFLQIHLMSAHALGKRQDAAVKFLPAANYMVRRRVDEATRDGLGRGASAVNFYDNGVIQADAVIGKLLETLEEKGYLRDALVVVTADHGEALGENGRYGHSNSVAEPVLRVPLLLISYGHGPGAPIDGVRLGSQVDVAPTILEELGMPLPGSWAGRPLQARNSRDFVYFQQRSDVGLVDGRDRERLWKYWIDLRSEAEHAYELTADPWETRNVIAEVPPQLRWEWRRRVLPGAAQPAAQALP